MAQEPIKLMVNRPGLRYEMENLARVFFPAGVVAATEAGEEDHIYAAIETEGSGCRLVVRAYLSHTLTQREVALPVEPDPSEADLILGRLLYELLSALTGNKPPWGVLTGVRPIKLCHKMVRDGLDDTAILRELSERYLVTPSKARLALEVCRNEAPVLADCGEDGFSLYISIPFCPSRCTYCSFVSHDIEKAFKLVPRYLELLQEEIKATGRIAKTLGLRLQTVYMGGGTPTSLTAPQLRGIMEAVENSFDLSHLREYTVEAGRPDTITEDKLRIVKALGARRISINPQTMNDGVLEAIGRKHTAAQVRESMALARRVGFDSINMDAIAGLPSDNLPGFTHTIRSLLDMAPENITIHTLAVKRASALRSEGDCQSGSGAAAMVDYAREALGATGYRPYYLYRQKSTVDSLENTGYCLPGREGRYNICIMNETQTILAVGAGASTKLCLPGSGELRRIFNHKFPYEYIGRFDEILARKERVIGFYERHK